MQQDSILLKLIHDAGLDEKESKVYLAMLQSGPATVHQIAKISGLKRPIIYVILDDLIKKGYATELPNKKIRTYQPVDPRAIAAQMQTNAKNFIDMLPIFQTLANQGHTRPKISFFDTKDGIAKIFDQINQAKSAIFIASLARLELRFPGANQQWQRGYHKNFIKLQSRTIIPASKEDITIAKTFLSLTDKVAIRSLDAFDSCDMDICVFQNKMTITTFTQTPCMVLIESDAVPGFFLPLFEILWKAAKPIRK